MRRLVEDLKQVTRSTNGAAYINVLMAVNVMHIYIYSIYGPQFHDFLTPETSGYKRLLSIALTVNCNALRLCVALFIIPQ